MQDLLLKLLQSRKAQAFYFPEAVPPRHVSMTAIGLWSHVVDRLLDEFDIDVEGVHVGLFHCPDDGAAAARESLDDDDTTDEPRQSTSGRSENQEPRKESAVSGQGRMGLEAACPGLL